MPMPRCIKAEHGTSVVMPRYPTPVLGSIEVGPKTRKAVLGCPMLELRSLMLLLKSSVLVLKSHSPKLGSIEAGHKFIEVVAQVFELGFSTFAPRSIEVGTGTWMLVLGSLTSKPKSIEAALIPQG